MKLLQNDYIYRRLHQPFAQTNLIFSVDASMDSRLHITVTPDPQAVYDLFMDLFYPGNWQLDIKFSDNFTKAHVKIGIFIDRQWVWQQTCAVQQSDNENPWETAFLKTALLFGVGQYLQKLPKLWITVPEGGIPPDPKQAFSQFPEWAVRRTNETDTCFYSNLIRYPLQKNTSVSSCIS